MAQELISEQYLAQALAILPKGAFLTTAADGKVNTMTIGWGSLGVIWGKPVFSVLVRPSRFTYGLLEASGEFTVSVPLADMAKALGICGSKSGRDLDKFAAAGLQKLPGIKLATPVIGGAGLHYECKVVFKQPMNPALLDAGINAASYPSGDHHTIYYGLIEACWLE